MVKNSYETHRHEDPAFPIIFHMDVCRSTVQGVFMHWHENLELLYFTEGAGLVTEEGITILAEPGDLVVINSDHLHKLRAQTKECHYYCLIIDKAFSDSFGLPIGDRLFQEKVRDQQISDLFERIIYEMMQKKPCYKQEVKLASLELILHLTRYYSRPDTGAEKGAARRISMVKEAVQFIKLHYKEQQTVEEIADYVGFSKYYLCRTFKDATGYSVIEYVNFLRCQNARGLMKSGQYNVSQSAAMSGFQNLSYFTRTYKRQFGRMPSEDAGLPVRTQQKKD